MSSRARLFLLVAVLVAGVAAAVAVTLLADDTPAPEVAPPDSPAAAPTPASPSPSPSPEPTPEPPPEVATHEDADDLAETLVAAEQAIRDPETPADHLPGWAWVQQAAYRELGANPDWQAEVAAQVPAELRGAFDANLAATTELRAMTSPRDSLPAWRIVAPPPADELLGYYREAADEFGLDWSYLAAIHLVETRMGRIHGVSVAGARGPMQFMPATWDAYGEGDVDDPRDAIRAAARYLRAHGAPGDMDRALFAYNRSQRYVRAIEAYASVMRSEPSTYHAYYNWRVYYRLATGDVVLEEGYAG